MVSVKKTGHLFIEIEDYFYIEKSIKIKYTTIALKKLNNIINWEIKKRIVNFF